MEIKTTTEIKIQKFIMTYGAETLISWLDNFEVVINSKDYPLYRNLEREACKACEITLSDMRMFTTTNCTNAKRIISLIAVHQFKLKIPSVSNLLGISDRTVRYYIKDAEDWINNPKSNKGFVEAYNRVIEKFNN